MRKKSAKIRKSSAGIPQTGFVRFLELLTAKISTAGTKSNCSISLIRMASLRCGKHDTLYSDRSEREGATDREFTKNAEVIATSFLTKVAENNEMVVNRHKMQGSRTLYADGVKRCQGMCKHMIPVLPNSDISPIDSNDSGDPGNIPSTNTGEHSAFFEGLTTRN